MIRKLLPLLFTLILYGCHISRPIGEDAFFSQVLEREHLADSNVLILYIAEGMCAECINKELINLNEYDDIRRNTVIVGSLSNKRHFLSSVNAVSVKRKIFIPTKDMPDIKFASVMQPHYILYIALGGYFEAPYYPTDCGPERTIGYYNSIRALFPDPEVPHKVGGASR